MTEDRLFYDEYELPKNRKKRIISDLDDIDSQDDDIILMSTERKKNEKKEKEDNGEDASSWITALSTLSTSKIRASRSTKDLFGRGKKKDKKKRKNNEPTDYVKEFEPEVALIDNLLIEQSRFVDSLQQKYDRMESTKSSIRGTGKFTTDLINSINTARDLSARLVNQKISTKKTIHELEMKERKELGTGLNEENIGNFASEYLKNILNERNNLATNYGDISIDDISDEDIQDIVESNIDDDRGDEVAAYLRYEGRNVQIIVEMNPNDIDDYVFIAQAEDGEVLFDYPLPEKTSLSFNRSTMIATDKYGKKYHVEFRE